MERERERERESESTHLKMYFIPFLAPGHMTPLTEIARLFAGRRQHVTVITTAGNAALLYKHTSDTLSLHVVDFPAKEAGLPAGVENLASVNDGETVGKLFHAVRLMQPTIESFIVSNPPDCLVSDVLYPWAAALAARIGIPHLMFHGTCAFSLTLERAVGGPEDGPHTRAVSDYDPFEIPGLPDKIVMTRSQLPIHIRFPKRGGFAEQLLEQWREAESKTCGVLVNSFYELDSAYTEHIAKVNGLRVWNVGPAGLAIYRNSDASEKVDRGHMAVVGQLECLGWLDSKEPNSVLYVCFGSQCRFRDYQLYEIASALRSSGAHFIWVVLGEDSDSDAEKWLPSGFEAEVRESGRGMIIRGWAPQVLILDHPAIGGFMTHCGWNSVIEALSARVPMVTWPLYAEQFYNEKLATQVLGVGVEVGVEDWLPLMEAGMKFVRREKIEAAVRRVMDGGDEVVEMRRKAKELGEKARKAVEEGGSSHRNLITLIRDLKRMREGGTMAN